MHQLFYRHHNTRLHLTISMSRRRLVFYLIENSLSFRYFVLSCVDLVLFLIFVFALRIILSFTNWRFLIRKLINQFNNILSHTYIHINTCARAYTQTQSVYSLLIQFSFFNLHFLYVFLILFSFVFLCYRFV